MWVSRIGFIRGIPQSRPPTKKINRRKLRQRPLPIQIETALINGNPSVGAVFKIKATQLINSSRRRNDEMRKGQVVYNRQNLPINYDGAVYEVIRDKNSAGCPIKLYSIIGSGFFRTSGCLQ